MPKTLDTNLLEELNNLRSTYPWLMLVEFSKNFGEYTYCVSNPEAVSWDSISWLPFSFKVGNIKSTSAASLPKTSISFFNTIKFLKAIESSIIGTSVTIYFLNDKHKGDYTRTNYPLKFSFKVTGTSVAEFITLQLGSPDYLLARLPAKKYVRDYCNFRFLGEHCWLNTTDFITLIGLDSSLPTDCNKSYETCKTFWESGTLNQPSVTPNYVGFGGFPTIDKGDINYV